MQTKTCDLCPCAIKSLVNTSEVYICQRTHRRCPYEGINGTDTTYICKEFKEALSGN